MVKEKKLPGVEDGFLAGPGNQSHLMGHPLPLNAMHVLLKMVHRLPLYRTDNCSHNGDKLKKRPALWHM